MTQTKLLVLGDNDELICQKVIASLKGSPEYIIVYVNGKGMCGMVSSVISDELEDLGAINYNNCVDMPDDVSDNKRIGRKHNKPFYQKGRW